MIPTLKKMGETDSWRAEVTRSKDQSMASVSMSDSVHVRVHMCQPGWVKSMCDCMHDNKSLWPINVASQEDISRLMNTFHHFNKTYSGGN